MKHPLYAALGAAAAAMLPFSVLAGPTTPTPSPALSTIVAAAPGSDYVEADKTAPGVIEGAFNAQQYIAFGTTSDPSAVKATLDQDGFIAGYGRTWVQRATAHAIVEAAVAFTGGTGAKNWLAASELADKSDPSYKSAVSITGLGPYYGAYFVNTTNKTYINEYAFVKGNDFYLVAVASGADDVAATAVAQAQAQYKLAPAYTVPPADWPTQPSTNSTAYDIGYLTGHLVFYALLAGLILLVIGLIIRSRRRRAAAAVPAAYGAVTAPPPGAVQLSPDGNFWWDGQAWRDVSREAPPSARRSNDGAFWWDGSIWRPVPRPPM